jgi:hypothetical protein
MSDEDLRRLYAVVVARRTTPDGGACPSPEALQRVAERVGTEEERLAVLDHVGECAACQRDLEHFRVLQTPLTERRFMLAGVAAAAAIVLVAVFLWRAPTSPSDELRGNKDRVEPIAPRGAVSGERRPTFIWRAIPEAIGYTFELLDDRPARMLHLMVRDTTLTLPDSVTLVGGRAYSWRVRPVFPSGEGPASRFLTFTLQAP